MTINITGNPGVPSFGDPANFNTEAQAFFDWLMQETAGGFIYQLENISANDYFSVTAFMETVLLAANASDARTTLGAQAQDDHLDDLAALSAVSAAGKIMMSSAAGTWAYEDLVGTVSQSGGTPTGAVIEEGSNANGEYARFADGTQICVKEITGLGPISTSSGGLYVSSVISLGNFAATFASTPKVGISSFDGNATNLSSWPSGASDPTTTFAGSAFLWRATSSAATTFKLHVIAIGRWF